MRKLPWRRIWLALVCAARISFMFIGVALVLQMLAGGAHGGAGRSPAGGRSCRGADGRAEPGRKEHADGHSGASWPSRRSAWSGQLSLKELAALTQASKLFMGVDSAPMHIAAAVGTPTVAFVRPLPATSSGGRGACQAASWPARRIHAGLAGPTAVAAARSAIAW